MGCVMVLESLVVAAALIRTLKDDRGAPPGLELE